MDVKSAIYERRALRSLAPFEVTYDLIYDLAEKAGLAPSCFNNQLYHPSLLQDMMKRK